MSYVDAQLEAFIRSDDAKELITEKLFRGEISFILPDGLSFVSLGSMNKHYEEGLLPQIVNYNEVYFDCVGLGSLFIPCVQASTLWSPGTDKVRLRVESLSLVYPPGWKYPFVLSDAKLTL